MVWYAYILRERLLRNARWWSEVAHCQAAFWSRRKGQTRYGGDLLKPYLYDLLWRLLLVHIATYIKKADLKAESERDNVVDQFYPSLAARLFHPNFPLHQPETVQRSHPSDLSWDFELFQVREFARGG